MLTLKILNKDKEILTEISGKSISLNYSKEYREGDYIRLESSVDTYAAIKFDETMQESIIFIPDKSFEFAIPAENVRIGCYGKEAFCGENHVISAREVTEEEFYSYRKISLNSHDIHGKSKSYPHTSANFVTREDPAFMLGMLLMVLFTMKITEITHIILGQAEQEKTLNSSLISVTRF